MSFSIKQKANLPDHLSMIQEAHFQFLVLIPIQIQKGT